MQGVKSQDIVVLFKLASLEDRDDTGDPRRDDYTVRSLEDALGISKTEIGGAMRRCAEVGLALRARSDGRLRPHRRALLDFVVNGLKYVFPAEVGAMTRGMPTAFAAPMLDGLLFSAGEHIHVWPSAEGEVAGQGVTPLFRSVTFAAARDQGLYRYLALVDAIRLGGPRETGLAADQLSLALMK